MSLKSFHIAFIFISISLGGFCLLWGYDHYRFHADPLALAVALFGGFLLILLIPYGFWFSKKMKKIVPVLLFPILLGSNTALACSVCFGDPNSLLVKGAKSGILFLVVVIGCVLMSIAGVAFSWARKAKHS
jgi:hypothetical protein